MHVYRGSRGRGKGRPVSVKGVDPLRDSTGNLVV